MQTDINTVITEGRKKVKALHKIVDKYGSKSDEGKEAIKKEVELYKDINDKYGREVLVEMHVGKKSNFAKPHNSKGFGYGN